MRISKINKNIYIQTQKPQNNTTIPLKRTYCDSISFTSNDFEKSFRSLAKNLISYAYLNNQPKEKEIAKIFKEFCPKSTFKQTQRMQAQNSDVISYSGNTEKEYTIQQDFLGRKKAILKKQEISVIFPKDSSQKERIIFIGRLIHEGTHALQAESPKKETELDVINNFLKKERNLQTIKSNILSAFNFYETLSIELLGAINEAFEESLSDISSADEACRNYFSATIEEIAYELIQETMGDLGKNINLNFIFEYCKKVAQCEIEAYSKEKDFLKKANCSYEANQAQIKIDANKAIIYAIESLQ